MISSATNYSSPGTLKKPVNIESTWKLATRIYFLFWFWRGTLRWDYVKKSQSSCSRLPPGPQGLILSSPLPRAANAYLLHICASPRRPSKELCAHEGKRRSKYGGRIGLTGTEPQPQKVAKYLQLYLFLPLTERLNRFEPKIQKNPFLTNSWLEVARWPSSDHQVVSFLTRFFSSLTAFENK